MNLPRINELNNLINSLYKTLRKLKSRISNLEREVSKAAYAQERLEAAANAARNRVAGLTSLGLRAEFLEEIVQPVIKVPNVSSLSNTIKKEIFGTEDEIQRTNNRIWAADQEKKQLEMEEP